MTTEIGFEEAFTHTLTYCFDSIKEHIDDQVKPKKTAYSLFMKDQHEKLKEEVPDISIRSKTISGLWKNVSNKVEKEYKEKAINYVPEKNDQLKKKRKGGLNNFQMFCKIERDQYVKKDKNDKKQSTHELSEVWKKVNDDDKGNYRKAAEQYNLNHDDYSDLAKQFGKKKNSNKKQKNKIK